MGGLQRERSAVNELFGLIHVSAVQGSRWSKEGAQRQKLRGVVNCIHIKARTFEETGAARPGLLGRPAVARGHYGCRSEGRTNPG